jgi:hypothetical protein
VVRSGRRGARALIWVWALVETANGLAHIAMAIFTGGYFPGVATAPVLLGLGGWLIRRLTR